MNKPHSPPSPPPDHGGPRHVQPRQTRRRRRPSWRHSSACRPPSTAPGTASRSPTTVRRALRDQRSDLVAPPVGRREANTTGGRHEATAEYLAAGAHTEYQIDAPSGPHEVGARPRPSAQRRRRGERPATRAQSRCRASAVGWGRVLLKMDEGRFGGSQLRLSAGLSTRTPSSLVSLLSFVEEVGMFAGRINPSGSTLREKERELGECIVLIYLDSQHQSQWGTAV
ncbi:hypothetical protein DFJ73DRAFT_771769 [Zopfochytrium polystomum]|nr:hypothetical protein DFJ73DRAFT_771769 [Zopfochytrium polystomum]